MDVIYQIGCKNCPNSYIGVIASPVYVSLTNHRVEIANITEETVYTRNKRTKSTDIDYKSALSEHAATMNHVIEWATVKVIEQEQNW